MASYFEGSIGQKIICDCGVDISLATTRTIKYQKPNGTTGSWTAAQETTTSISYTTTAITDLNFTGIWRFQSYVITPTWTHHGEIDKKMIKENL